MDVTYTAALTQLDDSVAEFGGGKALPDRVVFTLPIEAWIKLGRPSWVSITPLAAEDPTRLRSL